MEFLEIYDITSIFDKETIKSYTDNGYVGVYYSRDVHDIHVFRVLENTNAEYQTEKGTYLLEYDRVPINVLYLNINTGIKDTLLRVLEYDIIHLDNWNSEEFDSYDEVVEKIKSGYVDTFISVLPNE